MADVVATLKSIDANSFKSDEERNLAVLEAHALLSRIEDPIQTTMRLALTVPTQMACLKTALDIGLFQKWLQKNDGNEASLEELNNLVQCDPVLFSRLMRHLASCNMVWTNQKSMYKMTPYTRSLEKENLACAVRHSSEMFTPAALHFPAFLNHVQYQNPTGGDKDCFKHWSNMTAWEYLAANPPAAKSVHEWMQASSRDRGNFTESYPCEGLSCPEGQALIVDIGGSVGHDIQTFRKRFPNATGRLVLEDLPETIDKAKQNDLDPSIETLPYDFFTPQPVTDAKIYLLHSVLHDWPDADVKRILEKLKPAMKKGYSKLLVHEIVVPEVGASMEETTRDLAMLILASGSERTKSQWTEIMNDAGFKINKIWRTSRYAEAVIEVEVV